MKRYLFVLAALLAAFAARADQFQMQTINNSGDSITITNGPASTNGAFLYSITGGTPATLTIVLQGCTAAAVCTTLNTYTTPASTKITPTLSTAYANFNVQANWTGCGKCTVVVGSNLVTPAAKSGGSTVASGTAALGTAQIASGAAAPVVSVSAPGVLSTDNILADFNSDPTGVTGFAPSTDGMLTIIKFPTADHVNFIVVNDTGVAVTPGAITLNWRVVR